MTQIDTSAGNDSFLDIVANLVGILIILVVLIGAQAATVWNNQAQTAEQVAEVDHLQSEAEVRFFESTSLEKENGELRRSVAQEHGISIQLTANRHKILLASEETLRDIRARKEQLTEGQRLSHESKIKIDSLKQTIRKVRYEFTAVNHHSRPVVETIKHYPTPIAKTVFSDEIHFRILNGRIVHVPLNELVVAMKNEWQIKAKKLDHAENTWETVGPIGNFRLQYLLTVVAKSNSSPSQYGIEFERFVLQPTSQIIGEEIADSLRTGSEFRTLVGRMTPNKTTVSLWVYPDAYDHLTTIRKWLRERGYQTASWPLEVGRPIGGGPQGFRTTTN